MTWEDVLPWTAPAPPALTCAEEGTSRVEALIAALVSAVTWVTVAALSFQFTSRQQRRSAGQNERKEINARYLNPLRFQVADNHVRLWQILNRPAIRERVRVISGPEEVSAKDWAWFNGLGNYLLSSAYLMACMFAGLQKVREDIPSLRLSGTDDTKLVELILEVQIALLRQQGAQYVIQTSIGQDMWLRAEARLRTYREFCELLRDPDSRIWFDRIFTFFLETGRGKKTDRALNAISAMENLVGFLDQCVGGGSAIASRWNAEKLSPKEMTVCQADGAAD